MNGSLPLPSPVSYILEVHVKSLYTLSPDLVWGLYMPTNPSLPAFLTAHTHLPCASFPLHNIQAYQGYEVSKKGMKLLHLCILEKHLGAAATRKSSQWNLILPLSISIISTQAQWHSSQLNVARVNRHPTENIIYTLVQKVTVLLQHFLSTAACKVAAHYIRTSYDILIDLSVAAHEDPSWCLFLMCDWYFLITDNQFYSSCKPSFQHICKLFLLPFWCTNLSCLIFFPKTNYRKDLYFFNHSTTDYFWEILSKPNLCS